MLPLLGKLTISPMPLTLRQLSPPYLYGHNGAIVRARAVPITLGFHDGDLRPRAPAPTPTTAPTCSTRGRRRRRSTRSSSPAPRAPVLGRRRQPLPRLLVPAGQRQHRPPAPEAGRGDQGAGRPAVHGRPDPRQRRPQRGGPADRRAARPGDLDMVFFTNGGAEATENAIRMARLHTGRHKVLGDLPQLPRRHRRVDHDDRRPAPLGQRAGHARRRAVLGAVPVPLGVPRRRRRRGVRAGARSTSPT